jgi:hypothetical protein
LFESKPQGQEANTRSEDRFENSRLFNKWNAGKGSYFDSGAPFDDSFHSSEETFETASSIFGDPLADHSHEATTADDRVVPGLVHPSGRLSTVEDLREAFVLKEIVGPPRAHKRNIRS